MNIIFTILKNFFMNQSSSWSKSFFKLKKGNSSDSSFFMKLYIKYNLSLFRIYFYCTIFFRKHKINTDDYIILVVSITWLPTKSCFSPAFAPTVQFWNLPKRVIKEKKCSNYLHNILWKFLILIICFKMNL